MRTLRFAAAAFCLAQVFAAQVFTTPAQAAEIKRFTEICQNKLCQWFLAHVPAPAGWTTNLNYSRANKMLTFLPAKRSIGPDDPLIYIRTSQNGGASTLDQFAETSNSRWRGMVQNAQIERLPDLERGAGKGAWRVYRYVNPGREDQAHELLAFGEHVKDGRSKFFHMVVLTASELSTVEKARPAFLNLVKRL